MAAIPEPSHTVSYTGQPPIYGAIYINTLLYVELLVLYMPADKQLGETAVWISWAMCTQTIIAQIYFHKYVCWHVTSMCTQNIIARTNILSPICLSTCHKYVHVNHYCAYQYTFTNMSVECQHITNMCSKLLLHIQLYFRHKYNCWLMKALYICTGKPIPVPNDIGAYKKTFINMSYVMCVTYSHWMTNVLDTNHCCYYVGHILSLQCVICHVQANHCTNILSQICVMHSCCGSQIYCCFGLSILFKHKRTDLMNLLIQRRRSRPTM